MSRFLRRDGDGAPQAGRRSVYEQRFTLAPKPEHPDEHWVPIETFIARGGVWAPIESRWPPRWRGWDPHDPPSYPIGGGPPIT